MAEELKSEGKCLYCGQVFAKRGIGKHLATHLAEKEKADTNSQNQTYCHIVVDAGEMFLQLLVKGDFTMKKMDDYLRRIWLECCGHMSGFSAKTTEIKMSHKVMQVFNSYDKIQHDYDFGSTTRVFLKSINNYQLNIKENITLLSRNEPLELMCAMCKTEAAVNLCTTCSYDEYSFFCEKCSEEHAKVCEDFEEYSSMPVVNSPRMGTCGYTGGTIDLDRDGHFGK